MDMIQFSAEMKWIRHPEESRESRLVPVFRREFTAKTGLKSAVLHITAHGIYETKLNGGPVTKDCFTPGLTSYYHRIQVQEYDAKPTLNLGSQL